MSISKTISDFAGVLQATREELDNVTAELRAAEAQRREIVQARPHTDDIVAAFMRSLGAAANDFEQQLASNLESTFVHAADAAQAIHLNGFDLLRLEAKRPDQETLRTRHMKGERAPINMAVLNYLLRDKIAAEIPALVDKLCPAARKGMTTVDRKAALAEIDGKLAELGAKRDALIAELEAARRVASGGSAE